ncbi:DUF551 domain-containing protein [Olivibacter sp. LS-1]|uniref:DUF551 domain-containing protein n=1 Tax=Olivibacter sp. LS-1 TaxID=2592345 RepID=UPI0011EA92AB|nr:DUF551 domain-containing protein [Olivibacter sp. LS-1]QEL01598.1 DUF551 domain-containing protein [Olivibacter sp. LS-1]
MNWIKVKDKLPDRSFLDPDESILSLPLLLWHDKRGYTLGVFNFDMGTFNDQFGIDNTEEVTHWVPLPDKPTV